MFLCIPDRLDNIFLILALHFIQTPKANLMKKTTSSLPGAAISFYST
jgi:hypothetical protein